MNNQDIKVDLGTVNRDALYILIFSMSINEMFCSQASRSPSPTAKLTVGTDTPNLFATAVIVMPNL